MPKKSPPVIQELWQQGHEIKGRCNHGGGGLKPIIFRRLQPGNDWFCLVLEAEKLMTSHTSPFWVTYFLNSFFGCLKHLKTVSKQSPLVLQVANNSHNLGVLAAIPKVALSGFAGFFRATSGWRWPPDVDLRPGKLPKIVDMMNQWCMSTHFSMLWYDLDWFGIIWFWIYLILSRKFPKTSFKARSKLVSQCVVSLFPGPISSSYSCQLVPKERPRYMLIRRKRRAPVAAPKLA